jgi:predicted MFS family arabinose efflux permease
VRALTATLTKSSDSSSVFWRYWTGSTISGFGTAVTSVALPLTAVLVVHASVFSVAAITAAGGLPWLVLGLPAGVFVSRLPLRGTQVAMDLVRAFAIGSIPVVGWLGDLGVAQLLAVALAVGSASVIFLVASSTMMPAIVPADELTKRNSLTQAARGVAQLSGPGLGGVLVEVIGAASCMVVDAVSYLVSAVFLWTLPRPDMAPRRTEPASFRKELAEGFAYIRAHPVFRATFALSACVNLIGAAILALMPLYVVRTLGAPAYALGLVYASEGAGALVGAALATRLSSTWGSARTLLRCSLPVPFVLLLLPLAFRGAGVVLCGLGIFGFVATLTVAVVVIVTHRQRVVPIEMLPRVLAMTHVVSWGSAPIGALIAGAVASAIGVRAALFGVAVAGLGAPLSVWTSDAVRQSANLEDVSVRQEAGTLTATD